MNATTTTTSDSREVIGVFRGGDITVTRAASGEFYTAGGGFGTSRDMKTRAGCVKWLKKVLADESNGAVWFE